MRQLANGHRDDSDTLFDTQLKASLFDPQPKAQASLFDPQPKAQA